MVKKIKDMNKEELNEYHRKKSKEWRLKNPIRNKELRKKYKKSEKGKKSNRKYERTYNQKPEVIIKRREYSKKYSKKPEVIIKRREYFKKYPEKFKQKKEYINNYIKKYFKNEDNHKKYLIRQKDYRNLRKKLINLYKSCKFCNSKEKLELHHKNYEGEGNLDNIIVLCRKCHKKLHRKY